MNPKKDSYAFISYSSANRDDAKKLFDILTNQRNRLTCWLDVIELDGQGVVFQKQIVEGIKNASCLVLVETEEAKKSDYVDMELKTALSANIPVIRFSPKKGQSKLIESIRLFFLAQLIKFRATQPYWVSLTLFILLLGIMAGIVFLFGSLVFPTAVRAASRLLPEAVYNAISQPDEQNISPEVAAPFHYIPDSALLLEDFSNGDQWIRNYFHYDIKPRNENVKINAVNGLLQFEIPEFCYSNELRWDCEIEIQSPQYPLDSIQYFAFRAKLDQTSNAENISLSISIPSWTRRRSGFGWDLSAHVTPFFRSSTKLPEQDFYAYVETDQNWHAYEILLDPKTSILYYYVDGQLIDTHKMQYYEEWKSAPLKLIIYALGNGNSNLETKDKVDTQIEIDKIIIGSIH